MAQIITAHDLSGVGRCSLNAAIPILSAMGHHCLALPTAILSNQTGFGDYSYLDLTGEIPAYLEHWKRRSLRPDAIYTGFLGSEAQPAMIAERLISQYPDAFVLVDPVMGDAGELYSCFDRNYVREMKRLVAHAHLITPNPTELFLLSDLPPDTDWSNLSDQEFLKIASEIASGTLKQIIVTGCRSKELAQILHIDLEHQAVYRLNYRDTGVGYSGTGDIFASVLCGAVMRGTPLAEAVKLASDFISLALGKLSPENDPREGIPFELYLGRLVSNVSR